MQNNVQLKTVLKEHGYTVKNLYLRINLKVWTNYDEVKRFCRSVNVSHFKPKLKEVIIDELKVMGVDWSLPQ